jgi:hypothetical protein
MKSLLVFLYLTIITLLTSTNSYCQTLRFPEDLDGIYKKWEGMTAIQKKEFLQAYNGNLISGSGKIISIEDGGSIFGCERSKHTWLFGLMPSCYKVSVMRIAPECSLGGLDAFGIKVPRAQECLKLHTTELYFSKKEKTKLLTLKKGEILNYNNCKILYISNAFYSSVYCDADFSSPARQEVKNNNDQAIKISKKLNIPIAVATSLVNQYKNVSEILEFSQSIDLNGDNIKDYIFKESSCGNMIGCSYIGIVSQGSEFIGFDLGYEITVKKINGINLPIIEDSSNESKQWSVNNFKKIKN